MIKKAAKIAVGIAIGFTIGGCIIPRIIFKSIYNDTWPPIWKQGMLYLITGFIAAFSVLILIYRIQDHLSKGKKSQKNAKDKYKEQGSIRSRTVFDSELPADIDWDEVNEFLRTTGFYKQLLLDDWRKSDAFTVYPVSDISINCMRCLHEDLISCYKGIFAFDENGKEDRDEEYRLLREHLRIKYGKIDEVILNGIYCNYLQEDR